MIFMKSVAAFLKNYARKQLWKPKENGTWCKRHFLIRIVIIPTIAKQTAKGLRINDCKKLLPSLKTELKKLLGIPGRNKIHIDLSDILSEDLSAVVTLISIFYNIVKRGRDVDPATFAA